MRKDVELSRCTEGQAARVSTSNPLSKSNGQAVVEADEVNGLAIMEADEDKSALSALLQIQRCLVSGADLPPHPNRANRVYMTTTFCSSSS